MRFLTVRFKYDPRQTSLAALISFNFTILLTRMILAKSVFFGFLIWNIFLSAIPFCLSEILLGKGKIAGSHAGFISLSLLWLLFFPNAPYLITDFLHFRRDSLMPEWFDILLLMSFAWSGLSFGFLSLSDMYDLWKSKYGRIAANSFLITTSLLAGFGMYLGRFLRVNSWDMLTRPLDILSSAAAVSMKHGAIGFSLGYGVFLLLSHYFFRINIQCRK